MANLTIDDVYKLLTGQFGVIALGVLIIATGAKRLWVWGYQLVEQKELTAKAEEEAKDWRNRFLKTTEQTAEAISLAHKTVEKG